MLPGWEFRFGCTEDASIRYLLFSTSFPTETLWYREQSEKVFEVIKQKGVEKEEDSAAFKAIESVQKDHTAEKTMKAGYCPCKTCNP